ncbi:O-antigen ligase family protein, partial [Candidatus Pelagibacter sp.]|nr:O-antigen ligase family protein [Candidatus Pelagibacter sp.]
ILDGFHEYFYKNTGNRVTSFFGDEEILGSYLSRLWPIFFGLSLIFFKNKKKLLFLISLIFILSEVLIFLSGDRTAFFYINLSAIFIIIFSKNLFKLRIITLLSSLFIIVIISLFNPSAKERVVDYTIDQMNLANKNQQNKEVYIFSKEHTHHYITAYRMFLDNKILGVGVKNFRIFCNYEDYKKSHLSCSTHPHNTYIQILSETGIIGFIFLIAVLIFFCKNIFFHLFLKFKSKTYFNDFEICILSCLAIYLWPFAPHRKRI